jgi:hypothetical protein
MGGLLLRSAGHGASQKQLSGLSRVQRAISVGTPPLGAPAAGVGRLVAPLLRAIPDPYTHLVGALGDLRSAGIKDLGDADLRHEDRAPLGAPISLRDPRHPLPLLPGIDHALIAGSLSTRQGMVAALFGDALVPVASATARGMIGAEAMDWPAARLEVLPGRSHLDLPHDADVYAFIKRCCQP